MKEHWTHTDETSENLRKIRVFSLRPQGTFSGRTPLPLPLIEPAASKLYSSCWYCCLLCWVSFFPSTTAQMYDDLVSETTVHTALLMKRRGQFKYLTTNNLETYPLNLHSSLSRSLLQFSFFFSFVFFSFLLSTWLRACFYPLQVFPFPSLFFRSSWSGHYFAAGYDSRRKPLRQ